MAASSTLSPYQFGGGHRMKKDPGHTGQKSKPKFSGSEGSKTMRIAAGHVPPPQTVHRHHRKNSPKTRRAR
jgi:hypothetical protein